MPSTSKVGSIVTDCVRFEEMIAFWQDALHYEPRYPPDRGWAMLRDPSGKGPNLSFNKVRKKTRGLSNIHLDLYSHDREREIERLIAAGAKRHHQRYSPDDDFRVLEDPDGNLFCVVQLPKGEA